MSCKHNNIKYDCLHVIAAICYDGCHFNDGLHVIGRHGLHNNINYDCLHVIAGMVYITILIMIVYMLLAGKVYIMWKTH